MAIADQDNNSSPRASNNLKVASLASAVAANANCISVERRIEETFNNTDTDMEYAWLEPRHDPIVTDTNFAEIDFENFKNEDLAYAFSCGVSTWHFLFFIREQHKN